MPAEGNYISHWRADTQTRSVKCNFINITTSLRWPTLPSSAGVLSACDANMENTHGPESKAAGVDLCLRKTRCKQARVTQSSVPVSGVISSRAGCLRSVVTQNKRIYSLSSTTICNWHQWVCEHFFHFTLRLMMGSTESSLGIFIFMLRTTKVARTISSPVCCLCGDVLSLPTQHPAVQKQCRCLLRWYSSRRNSPPNKEKWRLLPSA